MVKEPNVKDKTNDRSKFSEEYKEFLTDLRTKVANDDDARANWKTKAIISTNQRLGVKRRSNNPYPNAPNIPLPETDKLIKKGVPSLVLSAWSPKKKCLVQVKQGIKVTPELKEKAFRAELAMNCVLTSSEMNWFKKLLLAADNRKQYGFCLFRVYEDFRSRIIHRSIDLNEYPQEIIDQIKKAPKEQKVAFIAQRYNFDIEDEDDREVIADIISQLKSGEDVIEFDQEEITSMPNVDVVLPTKVIVPPYTTDINKANRVCYEYYLTKTELELMMENGVFKKKGLDKLDFDGVQKGESDEVEQHKGRVEGIDDDVSGSDLYKIHSVRCWYKPKGKKRAERWIFTFFADVFSAEEALLQEIQFPYEFDGWDFEKDDNEVKDPRFYSTRGVPEKNRAYQDIMERCINNMLIRDEMNNTPMWEVQSTSEIMDAHIRFVPGEKIPVGQIGAEIKRLNEPNNVDVSSERILQMVKAFVEEYEGSTDQLFRNATNTGGGKTFGEIQAGIRQVTGPISIDVISFNETLSRVYKKMFDIMRERLGSSLYIDGVEVTREDFNFPAEVKSNGNLEVSDQDLATQKAITRLQVIAQFVQLGVVDQEDLYNALKDWLEKDGVKDPDQFCTHPMQIMKTQLGQAKQALMQMQQQAQGLQQVNQDANKQLSKTKKNYDREISKSEGELEAISEQKGGAVRGQAPQGAGAYPTR